MFIAEYYTLCLVLCIAGSLASTTVCINNEETAASCTGCSQTYSVSRGREIHVNTSDSRVHFCSDSVVALTEATITFTSSSNLMIGSTMSRTRIMGSGFHLVNVSNVSIYSIEFIDCGKAFASAHSDNMAFAVMLIEDSISIKISNVSFINSSGSGLIMLNIRGTSMLTNCTFRNSTTIDADTNVNQSVVYTGGLHIEMSTCDWSTLKEATTICENAKVVLNSSLLISECNFIDNHYAAGRTVQGGGLFIETTGLSAWNHVTIRDCHFINNSAFRGGGASIRMDQNVHQNTVEILNVTFISNLSPSIGGGVAVGYAFNESHPRKNKVIFSDCKFDRNKAEIHAGVSIYSSSSPDRLISENSIQFQDCRWTRNSAMSLGAAVGVVAIYNRAINNNIIINQWFIEIVFEGATFESNYFADDLGSSGGVRSGIVHITTIPVKFEGNTTFNSNNGTALEVVSSTVNCQHGAQMTFENNKASPNGAAINLIHTSEIAVSKGCKLTFSNNMACSGAAIKQHTIDPYDFIHSRKCFIKYRDRALENSQQEKPSLVFINNTATCDGFGNSIHLTTIRPCNYTYNIIGGIKCQPIFTNTSVFSCSASFEFLNVLNKTQISTDAKQIVISSKDNFVAAIPGKEVNLPIFAVDELNNVLPVVYTVTVSKGSITLDRAYKYITYSKSRFYGKPGSQGTIHITVNSARNQVEAHLEVTLSQCPPGLVLDNRKKACKCSTLAEGSHRYTPITECNETTNTAILTQNWWMNFDCNHKNKSLDVEDQLLYGQCPENHCLNDEFIRYLKLSIEGIDDHFMCHITRTGRLCSQCRENYTTHYHSNIYACGSKSTCHFGWLLYVISELFPVTCLLLFIILFDIKLTTGAVNGFIYFAQTIDKIVLDDTSNYFASSKITKIFLDGYALIIRMFNLNFFQINATSFCLWGSAQTLDMIAFRYVTTIYSLLLVFFIIVIAHYCNSKCFKEIVNKVRRKRLTARSTLIHGLTGFLVLSYSGFTSTSVNLLLSVSLYSKGHIRKYTAVYYNGEFTHLHGNHLYYAVPAIFVFATLGLLPPLLLISYPLCYKILSLLKLNESQFSHFLCTCIPLEKMKPLFDSFQSSFQDKYRFFSGLYFIFRLSTFAIQGALGNTVYFYAVITIQSSLVFALHAICRPYKNKKHNILESLFLFDIAIIAITFSTANIQFRSTGIVIVQLFLLYLPLVIMVAYTGQKVCRKVRRVKYFSRKVETNGHYQEFNDSMLFREAENRLK